MCGIIGCVTREADSSYLIGSEDLGRLRHRGPDGEGRYNDAFVTLGHTRLAILDPSPAGKQPMSSPCGRFVITFNGEIYNYRELRNDLCAANHTFRTRTDTEVLIAAFKQYGKKCLNYLRGMFAFAIWDRYERTLFVARDRCGERPFFYWFDGRRFVFASELKGLIPRLPETPRLNAAVVDMYLHFQYVPEPWTLLEGVHKLPAAHFLHLNVNSWRLDCQRYWSISSAPDEQGPIGPKIASALEEAVQIQLRSDVPVGIALSGGIDSSAIAALAHKNLGRGIHAFSVGYPGRPESDERGQARALGEQLGMIVHEVEIPVSDFVNAFPQMVVDLDEPIADPAAFAHLTVPKAAAAEGIKVLLGGIGGDEVFWGYEWTQQSILINRIRDLLSYFGLHSNKERPRAKSHRHSLFCSRRLPKIIRDLAIATELALRSNTPRDQMVFMELSRDFVDATNSVIELGITSQTTAMDLPSRFWPTVDNQSDKLCPRLRVFELLFKTWLVSNCLTLSDRVGMANSVEMRQPFLDHKLIEKVIGLQRRHHGWAVGHKNWLKKALHGTLPNEILRRHKRGFTPPVHEWLSGAIRHYGNDCIDGFLTQNEIIRREPMIKLMHSANEAKGHQLFTAYKLTLLEQWARNTANLGPVRNQTV